MVLGIDVNWSVLSLPQVLTTPDKVMYINFTLFLRSEVLQTKCFPATTTISMIFLRPPGPFVQPASKERREYFAELWNLKKPRVGAPRKKRVVEGRAQGKAPAHGASKKRARAQGASPRNSKKKGRPTNKKKLQAGAASQMIASFFKPSA